MLQNTLYRFTHAARSLCRRIARSYDSLRYLSDRRLALLAGANVLDTMSVSLIVPLLPLYAEQLGANYALIGLMFAAETFAKAVFSTPFGYLADRFDRRRLIALGTVVSGASVVALGFVESPVSFVALRLLDGAAGAMRLPATTAYIGDQYPTEERGRALGANKTMGMLGLAFGPAVGGLVAAGTTLAVPFVLLGAGTVGGGLLLAFRLPSGNGSSIEDEDDEDAPLAALWGRRGEVFTPTVAALSVTSLLSGFSAGAFSPLFPLLLRHNVNAGPGYTGLAWSAFGVAMFLFTPVGGTMADHAGRKPSMVGGRLLWVVVYLGLVVAAVRILPPALLFLGGFASALAGPAMGALTYDTAPAGFEGTLVGMYGTLGSVGATLGPIVAGAAAGVVGVELAFVALTILMVADVVVITVGIRESVT